MLPPNNAIHNIQTKPLHHSTLAIAMNSEGEPSAKRARKDDDGKLDPMNARIDQDANKEDANKKEHTKEEPANEEHTN